MPKILLPKKERKKRQKTRDALTDCTYTETRTYPDNPVTAITEQNILKRDPLILVFENGILEAERMYFLWLQDISLCLL